jgi:hypothetical protein
MAVVPGESSSKNHETRGVSIRTGYISSALRAQATATTVIIRARSQSLFFNKIRRALLFSVLSEMMQNFTAVYSPLDIVSAALTVYFVCVTTRAVLVRPGTSNGMSTAGTCIGCILHSMSRQSVLVVSDVTANSIHMRDVGTQQENTLLLIVSTTALVALITLLPPWFLQDAQQGSLRDLLVYSFTSRYSQLHIPGLQTAPGTGDPRGGVALLAHGLLFAVFNMLNCCKARAVERSQFQETLYQTAAMIFSNMFLVQILPDSTSQILPIAMLLGMYIVSDHLPMSSTVASFVLWRTAAETSVWVTRLLPGSTTDQMILFAVLLCVIPALDRKVASVLAVAALQTSVAHIMRAFTYLGNTGAAVSSVCVVLVVDIFLDGV